MKKNRKGWLLVWAVVVLSVAAGIGARLADPETIYFNGQVLTMGPANTTASAITVKNGRIVGVGSNEQLLASKGALARVVDLQGRTVIPGFVDAHSHFPGSGLDRVMSDLNSPPIGTVRNIAELQDALRARAAATKPGDWVQGFGYDDTMLAEMRHPTRQDLDQVSTNHPIYIVHISGHLAAANSKALARAGLDDNSPDPAGGRLQRDPATGALTGVLEETAMDLVSAHLPPYTLVEQYKVIRGSIDDYVSHGVTTAQNGYAEKAHIIALGEISRLGLLPLRVVVWPCEEVGREIAEGTFNPAKYNSDRFRVGAVKMIADGSIQGYTGYLREPYFVPPTPDQAGYRGYPVIKRDELADKIMYFHERGFQIAVHGNGDAAIDDILNGLERAEKAFPRPDARHVIIHAQMARDDQLDLMARLGVIPSFFALHTYYWGDRHLNIFMGPDRARRMSPTRSARERGLPFTIHTDTPVVPMDPLLLVWSAVNRTSYLGAPIGPDQSITALEALRATTIDAARQMFVEDSRGSIEPGKFADLVVLSANPLDQPETIRDLRVLETIVGGKTVYRAP